MMFDALRTVFAGMSPCYISLSCCLAFVGLLCKPASGGRGADEQHRRAPGVARRARRRRCSPPTF